VAPPVAVVPPVPGRPPVEPAAVAPPVAVDGLPLPADEQAPATVASAKRVKDRTRPMWRCAVIPPPAE
jgi:hypothetical protein